MRHSHHGRFAPSASTAVSSAHPCITSDNQQYSFSPWHRPQPWFHLSSTPTSPSLYLNPRNLLRMSRYQPHFVERFETHHLPPLYAYEADRKNFQRSSKEKCCVGKGWSGYRAGSDLCRTGNRIPAERNFSPRALAASVVSSTALILFRSFRSPCIPPAT